MRIFLILGLAAVMAFHTQAQIAVFDSTSPDGKVALYYEHSSSSQMDEGFEFYFRKSESLSPLSGNLVLDQPTDLGTDADMSNRLFSMIGSHFPAFQYFVTWSPDSQWVSIEGGAHKFGHMMIYHSVNGRFARVKLPDLEFRKFFDTHKNDLHVPDMGATAAIHKISPHDQAYVCWLKDGVLAISAYPYLFTNDFFFVVDAHTNPATVTGFCR